MKVIGEGPHIVLAWADDLRGPATAMSECGPYPTMALAERAAENVARMYPGSTAMVIRDRRRVVPDSHDGGGC